MLIRALVISDFPEILASTAKILAMHHPSKIFWRLVCRGPLKSSLFVRHRHTQTLIASKCHCALPLSQYLAFQMTVVVLMYHHGFRVNRIYTIRNTTLVFACLSPFLCLCHVHRLFWKEATMNFISILWFLMPLVGVSLF